MTPNPTVDSTASGGADTHQSTTAGGDAARKGKGRRRSSYLGVLLDNRHGLVANAVRPTRRGPRRRRRHVAGGQRAAGQHGRRRYDVASFVADVRVRDVTPHVALRWSAIDGRTTRHAGYHWCCRRCRAWTSIVGCDGTINVRSRSSSPIQQPASSYEEGQRRDRGSAPHQAIRADDGRQ